MKYLVIKGLDAIRALALETAQTWRPDYQMNKVQGMILKKYHHIPYKKHKIFFPYGFYVHCLFPEIKNKNVIFFNRIFNHFFNYISL